MQPALRILEAVLPVFVFIGVCGALLAFLRSKLEGGSFWDRLMGRPVRRRVVGSYHAVSSVCSPAERCFYGVLLQAVNGKATVLVKPRVIDVVTGSDPRFDFYRLASRHIDFVIVDNHALRPLAAVELDDTSHLARDVRERDRWLDEVCASAGLPLVRIRCARAYNVAEIQSELQSVGAEC